MLAYRAQPTLSRLTSCSPWNWNRPQLRYGGNNRSLGVGVKHQKFTKVAANYNMGSGKPDPHKMEEWWRRPGWNDMDMNQHVNNVKYFEWILEGAPSWITSTHQLSSINLEFRKECGMDATLKSLSKYIGNYNSESDCPTNGNGKGLIEVEHSLRLENGLEVVRGRTLWNLKHLHN
ncbi:hypothetical protein V6N13_015984 [Hibiscus sabdariffa]|uniref:Acyl-ACP thioesterase-like C-terminal domain-containing protein n=1 Tax=Hibiscus sabdariffa TaxID=183260 RepID=A0ABR2CXB2_9ROSI